MEWEASGVQNVLGGDPFIVLAAVSRGKGEMYASTTDKTGAEAGFKRRPTCNHAME